MTLLVLIVLYSCRLSHASLDDDSDTDDGFPLATQKQVYI